MNDKIIKIGDKILQQVGFEKDLNTPDESIGYVEGKMNEVDLAKWILRNSKSRNFDFVEDIHGSIIGVVAVGVKSIFTPNNCVSRDTIAGQHILQGTGEHSYTTKNGLTVSLLVDILSTYSNSKNADATNGKISFYENNAYFTFKSLQDDLKALKKLEEQKIKDEERLLDLEKGSEEANSLQKEIDKKEQDIINLRQKVLKHIAHEVALRDQPILDKYQDTIRRNKPLDGGLIINGGPGTGKTTSLIQRIVFLTSQTIKDYKVLTPDMDDLLFKDNKDNAWTFYSPTDLLKAYLEKAMLAESLSIRPDTVRTWDNHRSILLRETKLFNTETQRPFLNKTMARGVTFFKQSPNVYEKVNKSFLSAVLERQASKIQKIHDEQILQKLSEKTDNTEANNFRTLLREQVFKIRDSSSQALKFKKIESWVGFYISLEKSFESFFKEFNQTLTEELKKCVAIMQVKLLKDKNLLEWFENLVKETINSDPDIDDDPIPHEDTIPQTDDPSIKINQKLRSFVRAYSMYEYDKSNTKLSSQNKSILEKLNHYIDQKEIESFGLRLYFKKNYEKPTKGIEANLFNDIPLAYKEFRRVKYNKSFLSKDGLNAFGEIIQAGNNHLVYEEADYLLSFIFKLCKRLYKDKKAYYNKCTHSYVETFRNHVKAVIAIDEATDFSIWELAAMTELAHPLFNSTTLSGDLMQRLTNKGIKSWEDYIKIFPYTEKNDLFIAYRQSAKLLEVATELYKYSVKDDAHFYSHFKKDDLDPDPLIFISKKEDDKIEWLANRIIEIHNLYGTTFPSIAIFVKDDNECWHIAKKLNDYQKLIDHDLKATACTQGLILGAVTGIRVYPVEYIKGLEFGAVFYYNLDSSKEVKELLHKYIYVGLSRANLFLGITMNEDFKEDLKVLKPLFKEGQWK